MSRRTPVEDQTWQIAASRAHASRAIARRSTRARTLPRVAVGLSVLTGLGVATAWVEQQLPAAASTSTPGGGPASPDPGAVARDAAAKANAAQLAAYQNTLAALAKTLQADNQAIAGLGAVAARSGGAGSSTVRGGSGGSGGSSYSGGSGVSIPLPGIPKLPTLTIPVAPPIQGTTGASGAGR